MCFFFLWLRQPSNARNQTESGKDDSVSVSDAHVPPKDTSEDNPKDVEPEISAEDASEPLPDWIKTAHVRIRRGRL